MARIMGPGNSLLMSDINENEFSMPRAYKFPRQGDTSGVKEIHISGINFNFQDLRSWPVPLHGLETDLPLEYRGDWEKGVPEGHGTLLGYDSGKPYIIYEGGFKDGAFSGYGVLFARRFVIIGEFKNGLANGQMSFFLTSRPLGIDPEIRISLGSAFYKNGFIADGPITKYFYHIDTINTPSRMFDGIRKNGVVTGDWIDFPVVHTFADSNDELIVFGNYAQYTMPSTGDVYLGAYGEDHNICTKCMDRFYTSLGRPAYEPWDYRFPYKVDSKRKTLEVFGKLWHKPTARITYSGTIILGEIVAGAFDGPVEGYPIDGSGPLKGSAKKGAIQWDLYPAPPSAEPEQLASGLRIRIPPPKEWLPELLKPIEKVGDATATALRRVGDEAERFGKRVSKESARVWERMKKEEKRHGGEGKNVPAEQPMIIVTVKTITMPGSGSQDVVYARNPSQFRKIKATLKCRAAWDRPWQEYTIELGIGETKTLFVHPTTMQNFEHRVKSIAFME
jgi:hypothetical protein